MIEPAEEWVTQYEASAKKCDFCKRPMIECKKCEKRGCKTDINPRHPCNNTLLKWSYYQDPANFIMNGRVIVYERLYCKKCNDPNSRNFVYVTDESTD